MDGIGDGNHDYDNDDVNDDDDDDGTMTMRWRRRRWNDDDMKVMGSRALCHPSEATINLYQQFGEKSTRERDNLGGRKDRKGLRWKGLG